MAGSKAPYFAMLLLLIVLNGLVFITPYLESKGDPSGWLLHTAFAPTCHQLASRSLCLFTDGNGGYSIGDCLPQGSRPLSRATEITIDGRTGYKLPVCARDTAIYLAMLAGMLALPFMRRIESEEWPSKWLLVAACVPIGIDGVTQLLGFRESSNMLRLITGAIIGVALPFYLLPMLNSIISLVKEKLSPGKKGKEKKKGKKEN